MGEIFPGTLGLHHLLTITSTFSIPRSRFIQPSWSDTFFGLICKTVPWWNSICFINLVSIYCSISTSASRVCLICFPFSISGHLCYFYACSCFGIRSLCKILIYTRLFHIIQAYLSSQTTKMVETSGPIRRIMNCREWVYLCVQDTHRYGRR